MLKITPNFPLAIINLLLIKKPIEISRPTNKEVLNEERRETIVINSTGINDRVVGD